MDGIITVVIVAAAIIFKLVRKKLESATTDEVFPPIYFEPEQKTSEPEQKSSVFDQEENEKYEVVEEAEPALPVQKVVVTPAAVEQSVEEKKEKIDPKKLVIYSEIMKPKYNE